jgi:hypothetical protein
MRTSDFMNASSINGVDSANTELMTLQKDLIIEKQKNELVELKYRLERVQVEKASKLEDSLYSPALFEHYQKVAMSLSRSQLIPKSYHNKPEDIFVAMAMGYQLGFPVEQSLQDIAVINGRPCLWGDGLLAVAISHHACEYINESPILNEQGRIVGYTCKVKRKGHDEHVKQFTVEDAKCAGLLGKGGVWQNYPSRMLQMRARIAIRDKFADALRGIRIAEIENEDGEIMEGEIIQRPSNDQNLSHVDKLKQVLDIADATNNDEYTSAQQQVDDDLMISKEQLNKIEELFEIKLFNQERIDKALAYYKVDALEKLSYKQADKFLSQLERS